MKQMYKSFSGEVVESQVDMTKDAGLILCQGSQKIFSFFRLGRQDEELSLLRSARMIGFNKKFSKNHSSIKCQRWLQMYLKDMYA